MGTPRTWTEQECREEAAFIKRVDPQAPGGFFSFDPECFRSYCRLQAKAIGERSGQTAIANEILAHASKNTENK